VADMVLMGSRGRHRGLSYRASPPAAAADVRSPEIREATFGTPNPRGDRSEPAEAKAPRAAERVARNRVRLRGSAPSSLPRERALEAQQPALALDAAAVAAERAAAAQHAVAGHDDRDRVRAQRVARRARAARAARRRRRLLVARH